MIVPSLEESQIQRHKVTGFIKILPITSCDLLEDY